MAETCLLLALCQPEWRERLLGFASTSRAKLADAHTDVYTVVPSNVGLASIRRSGLRVCALYSIGRAKCWGSHGLDQTSVPKVSGSIRHLRVRPFHVL